MQPPSPEIAAACEDADRVVKKQRVCTSRTDAYLEKIIEEVRRVRAGLASGEASDPVAAVRDLQRAIDRDELVRNISKETRELHGAINKLGKDMERSFIPDICKATRSLPFDQTALNQVIAEHLYKEGKFRVGEAFVDETNIPEPKEIRVMFESVHRVLNEIRAKNLEPALAWAQEHRAQLSKDAGPSKFEFQLHRLRFLHTLQEQGQAAALRYAREHFHMFTQRHMPEIQRLMGLLVFCKNPHGKSPYADLQTSQWDDVAGEFMKQACGLMRQPHQSPLLVCVGAGSQVLPQLLKLADMMETRNQDIKACEQLPIELELGKEFLFHSIFACPVSRDQSSHDNPPKLLPCGHVLCEHSINKIAKNKARSFKCPYCPTEAVPMNCRRLTFPDILE